MVGKFTLMPCARRLSDSRWLIWLMRSCIALAEAPCSVAIHSSPLPISEHLPIRMKK
jgi:hypothetical protein